MPNAEPAMKAETAGTGLRAILVATVVAGALGYAIQLLAPALLTDDAAYVAFSVYWSTLYLCVAALSGVQQEVTRAARPVVDEPPTPVLRQFTLIAIGVVLAAVAVLALLFGNEILPDSTVALAVCLAIGVVGYLMVAVLSGVLYGLRLWLAVAWLTIVDAGIRAVLVVIALALGLAPEWIALAVSVPFGLAFLAVWLRTRPTVVGAFRLDVRLRRLIAHTLGTVVAAASMGAMLSGLPMFLGLTAHRSETAVLAGLILAVTLTRAPIVVPLLALQSYFISIFREGGRGMLRRILLALATAAGGVLLLSVAAWFIGPFVIGLVSSGRFEISSAMMAVITASAGLVALMCITGPALVSQSRHVPYAAGWLVAALLTVGFLLLPLPMEARLTAALLVPPAIGLVTHLIELVRTVDSMPSSPVAG
ncbi:hypothetical protein ASD56_14370 [Microbacterium sp. Root166]|uniref:hypothetical protein n=1 Tax=Microbacterium sp. Root166 TaxID=1736478 RepID=UPI0006F2A724|nr:hypothetical protein [Microbacterium sp. Root166]KQZ82071.1 hypothetical protein ASD56_14370 [Microbacterium sp. Root166]